MQVGKLFIILGILFVLLGLLFLFGPRIPGIRYFGHLPGDIRIQKEGFRFYFPWVTCLLVSLLLTLLFQLIHFFKK